MRKLIRLIKTKFEKPPEMLYSGKSLLSWLYEFDRENDFTIQSLTNALKESEDIFNDKEITAEDLNQILLKSEKESSLCLALITISFLENITKETETILINLINHDKNLVRRTTAITLTKIEKLNGLIAVIQGNKDGHSIGHTTQKEAIRIIGDLRPESNEAVLVLIEKLKSRDWRTQYIAADALANIGQPAKNQLIKSLDSKDRDLRYYSAYALKNFKPQISLPIIDHIIEDYHENEVEDSKKFKNFLFAILLSFFKLNK